MINIDKQRVAAVRKLEALGYSYQDGEWVPASTPAGAGGPRSLMTAEADAMHDLLLSVVRHFNTMLKLIYGPAYRKTYKRVYEGGRLRNRRVYRIPLLEEAAQAAGQDVPRVA